MAKSAVQKGGGKTGKSRQDRLKAALKSNMVKRKAQARARAAETDKEG